LSTEAEDSAGSGNEKAGGFVNKHGTTASQSDDSTFKMHNMPTCHSMLTFALQCQSYEIKGKQDCNTTLTVVTGNNASLSENQKV
jgi:hypothetical protein